MSYWVVPTTADIGIRAFGKNLERAGIKIGLIELKSCEFRGKLARARIKVRLIELKGW